MPAGQTVRQWLAAHGQAPRLCDLLWEPLAVAALNQRIDTATATTFVEVVRRMLGPGPDDAALVLPTRVADAHVHRPGRGLRRAPRRRRPRGQQPLGSCSGAGRAVGVELKDERVDAARGHLGRAVARAGRALRRRRRAEPSRPTVASATAMRSSPIVTVNLWFDRPVLARAVRRSCPGGRSSGRSTARRVTPGDATYVSMVCSGADDVVDQANDAIVARAHAELRHALPAVAGARLRPRHGRARAPRDLLARRR